MLMRAEPLYSYGMKFCKATMVYSTLLLLCTFAHKSYQIYIVFIEKAHGGDYSRDLHPAFGSLEAAGSWSHAPPGVRAEKT
jgi:hypothetical protein